MRRTGEQKTKKGNRKEKRRRRQDPRGRGKACWAGPGREGAGRPFGGPIRGSAGGGARQRQRGRQRGRERSRSRRGAGGGSPRDRRRLPAGEGGRRGDGTHRGQLSERLPACPRSAWNGRHTARGKTQRSGSGSGVLLFWGFVCFLTALGFLSSDVVPLCVPSLSALRLGGWFTA